MDNRIEEKLTKIQGYVEQLELILPETFEEYEKDEKTKFASERLFELSCENLLDVCFMIVSEKGKEKPLDNKDAIQKIVGLKVISKELGEKLKSLIGLRNLLVHQYGKIDEEIVFEHFKTELPDLTEFIESVLKYLKNK